MTSRAERLGIETASLLSTAAVIGREFDINLLARTMGREEDQVLDHLDGAVRAALLNESRTPGRFSFAHSLVNNTLYDELGATRQAQTHRRVAEALEELCGDETDARSEELAWHWLRTTTPQMPSKAVQHSIRAGERSLAALAPAEALAWFRRAIDVLDQTPEADQGQRCDALIGLGDAQRQLGNPAHSETLLEAGGSPRISATEHEWRGRRRPTHEGSRASSARSTSAGSRRWRQRSEYAKRTCSGRPFSRCSPSSSATRASPGASASAAKPSGWHGRAATATPSPGPWRVGRSRSRPRRR